MIERRELATAKTLYWVTFIIAVLATVGVTFLTSPGSADVKGHSKLLSVLPAAVAVGTMLLYLFVSRMWTRGATRHPDFADGFYYMGFLLTMVALVSTLMVIGDRSDTDLQQFVLRQFGLALTTTIVGLLGRNTIRMFADAGSVEDEDEDAHVALKRAAEALRVVLDNSATNMRTTLSTVEHTVSSGVEGVVTRLDSLSTRLGKVERAFEPLAEKFAVVGQRVDGLGGSLGGLSGSASSLGSSLEALGTRLGSLEAPLVRTQRNLVAVATALAKTLDVAARVEEVSASLAQSMESLGRFAVDAGGLPNLGADMARLTSAIGAGRTTVDDFIGSMREADSSLQRLATLPDHLDFAALEGLKDTLGRQVAGLESSMASWERGLTSLDEMTAEVSRRQEVASAALQSVREELAAGVRALTDDLGRST